MIRTDLDDFILPSQACINPFVGGTSASKDSAPTSGTIKLDSTISDLAYELDDNASHKSGTIKAKTKDDVKIASVTLTDCLACR